MEFSNELIQRCEQYYKKRTGIELSCEETEEFLRSLAGLYEIAVEIDEITREKTKNVSKV